MPTSGSLASAVIAVFAAGLLTKDGALAVAAMVPLLAVPVTVWQVCFAGQGGRVSGWRGLLSAGRAPGPVNSREAARAADGRRIGQPLW
jgi:hypothetical protein